MVLKNPFVDQANNAIDYWWELQALEPQVYYNTFFFHFIIMWMQLQKQLKFRKVIVSGASSINWNRKKKKQEQHKTHPKNLLNTGGWIFNFIGLKIYFELGSRIEKKLIIHKTSFLMKWKELVQLYVQEDHLNATIKKCFFFYLFSFPSVDEIE